MNLQFYFKSNLLSDILNFFAFSTKEPMTPESSFDSFKSARSRKVSNSNNPFLLFEDSNLEEEGDSDFSGYRTSLESEVSFDENKL